MNTTIFATGPLLLILSSATQAAPQLTPLSDLGLASFAIREQLARPQLVSTSRHLSQGGVDLVSLDWNENSLIGRSRVMQEVLRCAELVASSTADWQSQKVPLRRRAAPCPAPSGWAG